MVQAGAGPAQAPAAAGAEARLAFVQQHQVLGARQQGGAPGAQFGVGRGFAAGSSEEQQGIGLAQAQRAPFGVVRIADVQHGAVRRLELVQAGRIARAATGGIQHRDRPVAAERGSQVACRLARVEPRRLWQQGERARSRRHARAAAARDPVDRQPRDRTQRLGLTLDEVVEVDAREAQHFGIAQRADRGPARAPGDQAGFAGRLAGHHLAEETRPRARLEGAQRARDQHVQCIRRAAGLEQHLATAQAQGLEALHQPRPCIGRQPGEPRHGVDEGGPVGGGHGRSLRGGRGFGSAVA